MTDAPPRSLLERRLVIVTGKGGTGKTTVVASLALGAARAGRRVLVAEMGRDEQVPELFDPAGGPAGYAGRDVAPGVRAMRIDPFAALGEYLGLQLGMRPLVDAVLRNRGFRQLMTAAPGWRELITLGKVWHLEQAGSEGEGRAWDLIVVDAPATGHGVTFLDVPRVAVSAIRAGPLRRHASWVEDLVTDPDRTVLLPVALGEELPARETAELLERIRDGVGIAVDRVVVNAVTPPPYPAGLEELDTVLAALDDGLDLPGLPPPSVLAACGRHLRARHALNRRYVAEIAARTGLPAVELPYLHAGVHGPADLEVLARALLVRPEAAAA